MSASTMMGASSLTPFVVLSLFVLVWLRSLSKKHPPFPPGPPADPLTGHLRIIPSNNQGTFFHELGKKYGDVVHLHIPGRSMIILNSVGTAIDLLDKRSVKYSDRINFPVYEMMGLIHHLVHLKYGREFHIQRKMFQECLTRSKCTEYYPIQARQARVLVQSLLSDSEAHKRHFVWYTTAIIVRITYGHQLLSDNDPYLAIMERCSSMIANSGPPGGTPVDFFPILQYLPSWFPGTHYANYARRARGMIRNLYEFPFGEIRKQMANGTAKPSFLASQLETLGQEGSDKDDSIEIIKGAAAVMYFAGADTTALTLSIFLLAMVLYPECQAVAQKELDTVIGPGRLPEFNDRDLLPYLECLIQETIRWNPAVPAGVPHCALEDDIYNGMFIPKGSMIIPNTRGMTLDENIYSDPYKFDPTRYLPKPQGKGEPYPSAAFGFGRRICPGRHLASDSVWIAAATILMLLSVQKAVGEDGKEITPTAEFAGTAAASHPHPFRCSFQPRTEMAKSLISQMDVSDVY